VREWLAELAETFAKADLDDRPARLKLFAPLRAEAPSDELLLVCEFVGFSVCLSGMRAVYEMSRHNSSSTHRTRTTHRHTKHQTHREHTCGQYSAMEQY